MHLTSFENLSISLSILDVISSMTSIKDSFELGHTRYVLKDTLNGFERNRPVY